MRAKREPLSVSLAGPTPGPSMNLPRSLAHPPRVVSNPPSAAYGQAGGPPRAAYGQMHVLEQQELQTQMQQRGRVQQLQGQAGMRPIAPGGGGGGGGGGGEAGYPPGQGPQRQMGMPPQQQQQQQQQYGHAAPHMAQQQMHPAHQQQQGGSGGGPPGEGPPSAHGSPQLVPASHPYANGRPPQEQQQQQQGPPPGSMNPAFQAAMAAVGLAGRDPESLAGEEHVRSPLPCLLLLIADDDAC